MGNLKVRVKGLRPKDPRTPDPSQLPNVPDSPPQKGPGPGHGEHEVPGRSPFPGQTALDPSQIPDEPDRPPRKDLSQVMGNVRVRVKGLRKQRVETLSTALPDQEEVNPLGRPSCRNPFRRIKMAWAETKAVITTDAPPNTPEQQDLVIEAEEEGEATQQAEGKGLRPTFNKLLNLRIKDLSTFAARFHCGSYVR
ncbi:unnamed protein product [Arctogadus glacialis]